MLVQPMVTVTVSGAAHAKQVMRDGIANGALTKTTITTGMVTAKVSQILNY